MNRPSSPRPRRTPDVDVVVLDAGGDVSRQIAQIQDLIQQGVDAMIIWPTNGQAVIPAVREASRAEIPVVITNSNIAEEGFDFISSFSGPDNVTQGSRSGPRSCVTASTDMGNRGRGAGLLQITGQPGYTTAIERAEGFEERLPGGLPGNPNLQYRHAGGKPAGQLEPRGCAAGDGGFPRPVRRHRRRLFGANDNMGVGALNAALSAGRADEIVFVGATQLRRGLRRDGTGRILGGRSTSRRSMTPRPRCRPRSTSWAGEDVPFLNYFDTPKITQDNMGELPPARFSDPPRRAGPARCGRPRRCDRHAHRNEGNGRGRTAGSRGSRVHRHRSRPWQVGRAIGEALLDGGAKVCFADLDAARGRGGSRGEPCAPETGTATAVISAGVDVRDRGQVQAMIARTAAAFGRLDVMFNNAGVKQADELSRRDRRELAPYHGYQMAWAAMIGIQEAARQMIAQGGGRQDRQQPPRSRRGRGSTTWRPYCASKWAVVSLTQSAARDLARHENINR